MAVILTCPSGHRLKVPAKFAGKRVVCPVCGEGIDVPNSTREKPAQPVSDLASTMDFQELAAPTSISHPGNQVAAPVSSPSQSDYDEQQPLVAPSIRVESGGTDDADRDFTIQILTDEESDSALVDYVSHYSSRSFRGGILRLSVAAIFVALLCSVPSVVEHFNARSVGIRQPAPWTYFVLLMVTIQISAAAFALRIPDWATTWILCLVTTFVATGYACALALTMFATQSHRLLRDLGLLEEAFKYRAQPWCFGMMCTLVTLALFCGRHSYRWSQSMTTD